MKKEELLKYCLYYKGENKCPYPWDDPKSGFWQMEQRYYEYKYEGEHGRWEDFAASDDILEAFPVLEPLLKGDLNKAQKGFIAFYAVDVHSTSPMGLDEVLQKVAKNYGSK